MIKQRWKKTCPKLPGRYLIRCMETNDKPSLVEVFLIYEKLWVKDSDIGTCPLTTYHGSLMDLKWKKVL